LRAILDGASPEYRDLDLWEMVEKSKYGPAARAEWDAMLLAYVSLPNEMKKQATDAGRRILAPLMREIWNADSNARDKRRLCNRAAEVLEDLVAGDNFVFSGNRNVRRVAQTVLDSKILVRGPDGFSGETFRGWYDRMSVDQLLNADR
jgi:hypothetical protein